MLIPNHIEPKGKNKNMQQFQVPNAENCKEQCRLGKILAEEITGT